MEDMLRSVGMKTFIKYYDKFKLEEYSVQDIVQIMDVLENYTYDSSKMKASFGKQIFREHLQHEALIAIAHAEKVDESTKKVAQLLLRIWSNNNHDAMRNDGQKFGG
jgi:hypothetical protein